MSNHILPHNHADEHNVEYLKEQLDALPHFQPAAELFHQLGDTSRIRIFWLLCHREECVVNLSALLGMSSPAVSHHLRALRDCGLLQSRRDGKEVYYKVADTPTCDLLHKIVEQVMEITCPPEVSASPVEIAQQVHKHLMEHLGERFTIEELSRRFHINTTTLKQAFKAVYGTSIAAHITEHRMELAAKLLLTTQDSVAQIAQNVGFQSQSRFSDAFKKAYGQLPTDYRKSK